MGENTSGLSATRLDHPVREALAQGLTVLAVYGGAKLLLAMERWGPSVLIPDPELAVYLRADVVVAFACFALSLAILWPRLGAYRARVWATRGLVFVAALYAGINIGFFRQFSTPINRTLLQVARGGVTDMAGSMADRVTFANAVPLVLCLAVGAGLPWALSRVSWTRRGSRGALVGIVAACVVVVITGQVAVRSMEARGLDRNALWEAASLLLPEAHVASANAAERMMLASTPLPEGSLVEPGARNLDLSELRGAAADMNVLLVVMESTAAQYLGVYGADPDPMPHVTALADHALVFDAWYSPTPSSMKSLFAMLCATWPYPHPTAESFLAPRIPCQSLPEVLAQNGRRTQHVTSARFSYNNKRAFLEDRGYEELWDAASLPREEGTYIDSWGVAEEASTAQILRFVDSLDPDDRFFISYLPIFPHHPYVVPTGEAYAFGDATPFDKYRSAMAYSDRNIGHLVAELDARGLLDNTLIVVMGDHGEAFRQHPGNAIHSIAIYQENVHVPVVMSNPRLFGGQTRVPGPADHTTLAPTLLDLLGIEAPERWQGHSILDGERNIAHFFTDYSFLYLGLRDGRFKYIRDCQNGTEELYDLEADPNEKHSLTSDNPGLVDQYRDRTQHWYERQLILFEDYDAFLRGEAVASSAGTPIENLIPTRAEQGWGRLHVRRSVTNRPLRVGGRQYETGLGTHARSTIEYDLGGGYIRFDGLVGRDDASKAGAIEAEIWVDGVRLFGSGKLGRGQAAAFSIAVAEARVLELRGLDGGDGTRGDHVDWLNARLY